MKEPKFMIGPLKKQVAECSPYNADPPANVGRPFWLSLCGIIVSVTALGLACIPALAFDRPLLNPFASSRKLDPVPPRPPEREGGIQLKFKTFSVSVGGKTAEKPEAEVQADPEPQAELKQTQDPVRWFTIAATACALGGIVVALVGQTREKHRGLTAGSFACCAAAITWPYLAAGIAVGVAIAVFAIIIMMFGSIVS